MAIVCVLSVFNGFRGVISSRDSRIIPDLLVTSSSSSVINNADSLADAIRTIPGVEIATPVISDNAVAYRSHLQLPVRLLGVNPDEYRRATGIDLQLLKGGHFLKDNSIDSNGNTVPPAEAESEGEFDESALFMAQGVTEIDYTETPAGKTVLSNGAALQLGVSDPQNPIDYMSEGVVLFIPRRTASTINPTNPAASFMTDSIGIAGIIETEQNEFDANTMIVTIDCARGLLEYDTQATAIYIKLTNPESLTPDMLSQQIGPGYDVRDRLQQQTLHLRMISIEKWITFLLLSFILLIASFNVISTMSMLILDKRDDITTLTRLGASRNMVSEIFCWESAYVCAAGTISGIVIGVILCLIQQYFGLISIGGDTSQLIVTAYPVEVKVTDLLFVFIPSIGISIITASIAAAYARRQIS